MPSTRHQMIFQGNSERLDVYLARESGFSREYVQEQIRAGNVKIGGKAVLKPSHKLRSGDSLSADFEIESKLDLQAVAGELDILFEDEQLIILNKQQGIVVHPASGFNGPTLVHHLLHHLQHDQEFPKLSENRPGIVHRLDRGTSGCLIIAKNRIAQENISHQFKTRVIKKEYEAIAWGKTAALSGSIRSAIGRDTRDRKKMSSRTQMGRDSLTHWKREEGFQHFSHLFLFPHTGRTHQLRVHLSEFGHPIVGDSLYGRGTTLKRLTPLSPRIIEVLEAVKYPFLHARALLLLHPVTNQPLKVEAPRPGIFEAMLGLLRHDDR